MKKNFSDYLVSFVVLACSAVLLAALYFALAGWRGKGEARTLDIDYPNVTGVKLHSELRYAGAPAGRVSAIRLLTRAEREAAQGDARNNAVRVTVTLLDSVPPIPSDTTAAIGSDTLLSEKFVALSAGSPDAVPLENGAILQGRSGGSFDTALESVGQLVESLGPLLSTAEDTLKSIQPLVTSAIGALDTFKDGMADTLPRLSRLADSLSEAAISADTAVKRIDTLMADNSGAIKTDLELLKKALTQVNTTLDTAQKVLGNADKHLDARMKELSIVMQNLKVATTYAKIAFDTIAKRPNRLVFGSRDDELPTEAEILRATKPLPIPEKAKRR